MKAIVCESFGPLEELQFKDVADPQVKKGHVVVNVEAAGVNFPDGLLVQGLYQMQPDFPFIPGNEVAGTISEVGEGVSHLKEGQRVIALSNLGGYAEKALIPATHVMPLPDPIHVNEGAALVTAHAIKAARKTAARRNTGCNRRSGWYWLSSSANRQDYGR